MLLFNTDIENILPAVLPETRIDVGKMSYEELTHYLYNRGHCSAIIKLDDNMTDIYAGHNTWTTFDIVFFIYIYISYIYDIYNKII